MTKFSSPLSTKQRNIPRLYSGNITITLLALLLIIIAFNTIPAAGAPLCHEAIPLNTASDPPTRDPHCETLDVASDRSHHSAEPVGAAPCHTVGKALARCDALSGCDCHKPKSSVDNVIPLGIEKRRRKKHHPIEWIPMDELPLMPCYKRNKKMAWCHGAKCFCWPYSLEEPYHPPPPEKRSITGTAHLARTNSTRESPSVTSNLKAKSTQKSSSARSTSSTAKSTQKSSSVTSTNSTAKSTQKSSFVTSTKSTAKSTSTTALLLQSTPTAVTADEICTDGTPVTCEDGKCFCKPFSEFEPNVPRPASLSIAKRGPTSRTVTSSIGSTTAMPGDICPDGSPVQCVMAVCFCHFSTSSDVEKPRRKSPSGNWRGVGNLCPDGRLLLCDPDRCLCEAL